MHSLFHETIIDSNRIIYTPSSFARANLIHLQETGELQAQKQHISKREHLYSYLFFIVCEGSGTLEYNGTVYKLEKNDCVFIDCQKPYSHYCSKKSWKLKWIHFYGPNMNGIYEKYLKRGGKNVFHPHNLNVFQNALQCIYDIANSDDYIKDMRLFEQLTALLTLLMEESWNTEKHSEKYSKKQNVQQVKEYLDKNFTQKIVLDHLAEQFFINKFYLTRIFKEQFGISINSYLIQLRITQAKYLLRFTENSIEQIGIECGIHDSNYFSRIFKKIEGVSPGEFRKMWNQ